MTTFAERKASLQSQIDQLTTQADEYHDLIRDLDMRTDRLKKKLQLLEELEAEDAIDEVYVPASRTAQSLPPPSSSSIIPRSSGHVSFTDQLASADGRNYDSHLPPRSSVRSYTHPNQTTDEAFFAWVNRFSIQDFQISDVFNGMQIGRTAASNMLTRLRYEGKVTRTGERAQARYEITEMGKEYAKKYQGENTDSTGTGDE